MAYAGHQFGGFVPQLGDGRAILLGEVIDRNGRRRDIQLKGAGQTPFSRRGDGRAALGPVLARIYRQRGDVCARHSDDAGAGGGHDRRAGLSRRSAARRGLHPRRGKPYPGRHLPVLRRARRCRRLQGARRLCRSSGTIRRSRTAENPYLALLEAVAERQAALIARWLHVGFIHGVMNTDNMTISGETIDFGPCAFMDAYDPATVFSSIDHDGRYAYANQPAIGQWNLARLAETLLPLIDADAGRGGRSRE